MRTAMPSPGRVDHGSELDKAEVGQEREYACWAELHKPVIQKHLRMEYAVNLDSS